MNLGQIACSFVSSVSEEELYLFQTRIQDSVINHLLLLLRESERQQNFTWNIPWKETRYFKSKYLLK